MPGIISSLILIVFTLLVIYIIGRITKLYKVYKTIKSFKTFLILNFMDYQDSNYFNEITIKIKENEEIKMNIENNTLAVPIFEFKNKTILECEITIINSISKEFRIFKFSIYKDFINKANIYLNNKSKEFYSSDIIFYGNINKIKLNNFQADTFSLKKRLRCVILNIEQKALLKIIKDNNNYNNELNLKIPKALSRNISKNLIINIFIENNKSNVSIFAEEEQETLITATYEEKKMISEFYGNIIKNIDGEKNINKLCSSFKTRLLSKKILFGTNIKNFNNYEIFKIINTYFNQGVNFLFDNNLLNERDSNFIYGCLIILLYCCKKVHSIDNELIKELNNIIDKMKKNKFNIKEQIKAAISFVSFYTINNECRLSFCLKITKQLDNDSQYIKAFNFYNSIIKDLSENSDLMLMFLQLNSGAGKEILNNRSCYKISMISIKEIKEHLINNIPKYFFCYSMKNGEDIAISDPKTQIISFNEQEIFGTKDKDEELTENEINNDIMNILICVFHEGGHQKFHMNIKVSSKCEPIMFITKDYNFQSQEYLNVKEAKKANENGESGMSVDFYLYNFFLYPAQIISKSAQSYKLLKKEYFIGSLEQLNRISLEIIFEYLNKNNIPKDPSVSDDIDTLRNIIKSLNKENNDKLDDDDYIIINGKKHYCGVWINK